jgi:hypothetical protein
MALQPINLGGYVDIAKYEAAFDAQYYDATRPIIDKLGRRVEFLPNQHDAFVHRDNFAHACFGGKRQKWYTEAYWDQMRAERILWIEEALVNPDRICRDVVFYTNEKYLLKVLRAGQDAEYYCVVAENKGRDSSGKEIMEFITGYHIDWRTYSNYESIRPWVFPQRPPITPKNKKRGKKKQHQE